MELPPLPRTLILDYYDSCELPPLHPSCYLPG
jgi:hypothetical protein